MPSKKTDVSLKNTVQINIREYPKPRADLKPNATITLGDMHGNTMKLLHSLIYHGIITMTEEKFEAMWAIYQKTTEDISQKDLQDFYDILSQIDVKAGHVRLLGDMFDDRGNNDWFTLKLLERLAGHPELHYELMLSNHDLTLLLSTPNNPYGSDASDTQGKVGSFCKSGKNAIHLIKTSKLIRSEEFHALIEKHVFPHLKPISYSLSEDGKKITLFMHAPNNCEVIRQLAAELGVEYHAASALKLATTIDAINIKFQELCANRREFVEKMLAAFDGGAQITSLEKGYPDELSSLGSLTWNRGFRLSPEKRNPRDPYDGFTGEVKLSSNPPFVTRTVHGHTGEEGVRTSNPAQVNLDSDLGKELDRTIMRCRLLPLYSYSFVETLKDDDEEAQKHKVMKAPPGKPTYIFTSATLFRVDGESCDQINKVNIDSEAFKKLKAKFEAKPPESSLTEFSDVISTIDHACSQPQKGEMLFQVQGNNTVMIKVLGRKDLSISPVDQAKQGEKLTKEDQEKQKIYQIIMALITRVPPVFTDIEGTKLLGNPLLQSYIRQDTGSYLFYSEEEKVTNIRIEHWQEVSSVAWSLRPRSFKGNSGLDTNVKKLAAALKYNERNKIKEELQSVYNSIMEISRAHPNLDDYLGERKSAFAALRRDIETLAKIYNLELIKKTVKKVQFNTNDIATLQIPVLGNNSKEQGVMADDAKKTLGQIFIFGQPPQIIPPELGEMKQDKDGMRLYINDASQRTIYVYDMKPGDVYTQRTHGALSIQGESIKESSNDQTSDKTSCLAMHATIDRLRELTMQDIDITQASLLFLQRCIDTSVFAISSTFPIIQEMTKTDRKPTFVFEENIEARRISLKKREGENSGYEIEVISVWNNLRSKKGEKEKILLEDNENGIFTVTTAYVFTPTEQNQGVLTVENIDYTLDPRLLEIDTPIGKMFGTNGKSAENFEEEQIVLPTERERTPTYLLSDCELKKQVDKWLGETYENPIFADLVRRTEQAVFSTQGQIMLPTSTECLNSLEEENKKTNSDFETEKNELTKVSINWSKENKSKIAQLQKKIDTLCNQLSEYALKIRISKRANEKYNDTAVTGLVATVDEALYPKPVKGEIIPTNLRVLFSLAKSIKGELAILEKEQLQFNEYSANWTEENKEKAKKVPKSYVLDIDALRGKVNLLANRVYTSLEVEFTKIMVSADSSDTKYYKLLELKETIKDAIKIFGEKKPETSDENKNLGSLDKDIDIKIAQMQIQTFIDLYRQVPTELETLATIIGQELTLLKTRLGGTNNEQIKESLRAVHGGILILKADQQENSLLKLDKLIQVILDLALTYDVQMGTKTVKVEPRKGLVLAASTKEQKKQDNPNIKVYAEAWVLDKLKTLVKGTPEKPGKLKNIKIEIADAAGNIALRTLFTDPTKYLIDLVTLTRNEHSNVTGKINKNLWRNSGLTDSEIYALKDLVRQCQIVGATTSVAYGGYGSTRKTFWLKQQIILCDLSGLQFQEPYNSGRLVLIGLEDGIPKGALDDEIYQEVVGERKLSKDECIEYCKNKSQKRYIATKFCNKQCYFDLEAYKKFVLKDFLLVTKSINKSAHSNDKIAFRFLNYAAGFFASSLGDGNKLIANANYEGIIMALQTLQAMPENDRKPYLGHIKALEFPFYGDGKLVPDFEYKRSIIIELCEKLSLACEFTGIDALGSMSQESRKAGCNIIATTNTGDPHATLGNEGGTKPGASIPANAKANSVDAQFGINLQDRGASFSPVYNNAIGQVILPRDVIAADHNAVPDVKVGNEAENKEGGSTSTMRAAIMSGLEKPTRHSAIEKNLQSEATGGLWNIFARRLENRKGTVGPMPEEQTGAPTRSEVGASK